MEPALAWLDFNSAERGRTQCVLALFEQREARDELGLPTAQVSDRESGALTTNTGSEKGRVSRTQFSGTQAHFA